MRVCVTRTALPTAEILRIVRSVEEHSGERISSTMLPPEPAWIGHMAVGTKKISLRIDHIYDNFGTVEHFFTFSQLNSERSCGKAGIKTTTPSNLLPRKLRVQLYGFAAQLVQNSDQSDAETFNYSKCPRGTLITCLSTQADLQHVFKIAAFGIYVCVCGIEQHCVLLV